MRARLTMVLVCALALAALAGAGCKLDVPAPSLQLEPVPTQQRLQPGPDPARPLAALQEHPADAVLAAEAWTLPEAAVDHPTRARVAASRALAQGDLFETADSAIPLLWALRQARPDDAEVAGLLQRAQEALLGQARAALADADDLAALRYAQRMGLVLRTLWPDWPPAQALLGDIDRAGRAFDLSLAGERALRAGRIDGADGALAQFRDALRAWPVLARAAAGVQAVQVALVRQAFAQAAEDDFDGARQTLARAAQVRDDPALQVAAGRALEGIQADRLRRMRDEGLMALGDPGGLQFARERLADMLRIARPGDAASIELRQRIDVASRYGVFRPGQVFSDGFADGGRGPALIVAPHGTFVMGAGTSDGDATPDEQPRHDVDFQRGFAMSRTEVTVAQFRRFVQATGHVTRATHRGLSTAYDVRSGNFVRGNGIDWRSGYDGRPAADDMPVVHVTARDAEAYAAWLTAELGAHYRLPSESEFEYALRAGGTGRYPWGDGAPPPMAGNLAGGKDVSPNGRHWSNAFAGYGDGWWGPAPVGSFRANAFGLHDMEGNVSEWVADCWHKGYRRAPSSGAAWVNPGCRTRMYRGGSWASAPVQVRSAWRIAGGVDITNARVGFRVVRQL